MASDAHPEGDSGEPTYTPWLWLRYARKQLGDGHTGFARSMLEGLLDAHPDFVEARGWYGVALARGGHHRKAADALEPAAHLDGAAGEVLQSYATCLARLGRNKALRRFVARRWADLEPAWIWPGGTRPLDRALCAARDAIGPERRPDVGVFYHVPFCAGTSFAAAFRHHFGSTMASISRRGGQVDLAELLGDDRRLPDAVRFLRLHHPYPLDLSDRHAVWFTVLREPVARFVSGFRKRLEPKILPTLDFRTEPSLAATIDNAETNGLHDAMARDLAILHPELRGALIDRIDLAAPRSLAFEEELDFLPVTESLPPERLHRLATEVLEGFDLVGVVEHFDASYVLSGAAIGLAAMGAPIHKGRSRRKADPLTADQEARIGALHTVDAALWDEWRDRFERRFEPVLAALAAPATP